MIEKKEGVKPVLQSINNTVEYNLYNNIYVLFL